MPLCGPKLSLCGVILSAWGIVQLSLMGIFFYIQSVALVEDIPLKEEYTDLPQLMTDMEAGYHQNALNCWIAALLYLVTLCVSVQQFWMNNRTTYSVWELYSNIPQMGDIKMTETPSIKFPVYLAKLYTSFKTISSCKIVRNDGPNDINFFFN